MIDDLWVYKIVTPDEWQKALDAGEYQGSPDDARDGFIHLSFAPQLPGTLAKHFAGRGALQLLQLEAAALGEALRFEASRGGALFPHLYGSLDPALTARTWQLTPQDAGHGLPEELADAVCRTHLQLDAGLCGTPLDLTPGRARVAMDARPDMAADELSLVHGGFVFGMADYAAMLAVNDPLVVLAASECRFLAPCAVGDRLLADARVEHADARKPRVRVQVYCAERVVFEASFTCVVPRQHVLAARS